MQTFAHPLLIVHIVTASFKLWATLTVKESVLGTPQKY